MEEDESELFGTEERLDRFASEYVKLPVLWDKRDKDFNDKGARVATLKQLGAVLGVSPPSRRARRMADAASLFRSRLLRELMSACAEAALRGGAEGGSRGAARALLPAWARRAEAHLQLLPGLLAQQGKPQAAPAPAAPKNPKPPAADAPLVVSLSDPRTVQLARRIVRGLRREGARGWAAGAAGGALGRAALARVAERLGEPVDSVRLLWLGMQRRCLHKLRARSWRGDAGAPLAALEWAAADLAAAHGPPLLSAMHYQHYRALRGLLATFHLVQRFGLEPEPAQPPPRPRDWLRAASWYSRDPGRAAMSAVVLQRRWHDLRADTRRRLRAAWGRHGGGGGGGGGGEPVLALHEAVARRYPHVVTGAMPSWAEMLRNGQLAPLTSERGPVPGAAAPARDSSDSDSDSADNAVIVIDDENPNAPKTNIKTNVPESNSKTEAAKAPETPKPNDVVVSDLKKTDSEHTKDLKVQNNAQPVKPEPTKKLAEKPTTPVVANFDITDSDDDLQIDEGTDASESVMHALQLLDPRNIQATIEFASDEDDAPNDKDGVKTENVEEIKEDECTAEVESKPVEEVAHGNDKDSIVDAKKHDANSIKNESGAELVSGKDGNESPTSVSYKTAKVRNVSSDSDDDVLVIDDCQTEPSNAIDINLVDTLMMKELIKKNKKSNVKKEIGIGAELFKDTSNDTNDATTKDEVKKQIDDSVETIVIDDNSNSATNDITDKNPILTQMLTSTHDDVKLYKRIQAIKNKAKKTAFEHAGIGKQKPVIATTSLIDAFEMNIRNETPESISVSSSEDENDFEGGIDPKLLMCPVVLLTRVDDAPEPSPEPKPLHETACGLSPKQLANRRHLESLASLSETFFSIKRNVEMLRLCRPCVVMLEGVGGRRGRRGSTRLPKRVELPDIEEVRRNNRRMLTAQVAPLAQRKSAGAKGAAGEAAEGGEGGAPSTEELQRLLDDFVGDMREDAVCKRRNPAAGSSESADCQCGRCRLEALAAPPASGAAAALQARLLRRVASEARAHQKHRVETAQKRSRKKKPPPPPPPPPPRPPSPYDAERAHKEWVRQKNMAAEMFGVKPRILRKKPAAPAPTEVATITPVAPPPPPQTSTDTRPNVPPTSTFSDTAILTLKKSGHHVLDTNIRGQSTRHYFMNQEGVVSQMSQQAQLFGANSISTDLTVTPVPQTQNNLAYLPLTEENLIMQAQNQPIFKLTPNIFNVNAVADINKKLKGLASDPSVPADTSITPNEQPFAPIISNVLSLAAEKQPKSIPTLSSVPVSQSAKQHSSTPRSSLTMVRYPSKPQGCPKIVLNKSQLKTLPVWTDSEPHTPDARAVTANSNAPLLHNSQANNSISKIQNQTNVLYMQAGQSLLPGRENLGKVLTNPTSVSSTSFQAQPSLQVNSVYSGPSLASSLQNAPWVVSGQPGASTPLVLGPASTISQTSFEMMPPLGLNLNQPLLNLQNTLQVNSQPLLNAVPASSQLQLVLTPQQFNALQMQAGQQLAYMQAEQQVPTTPVHQANPLQISAVRSGPSASVMQGFQAVTNQQVPGIQERQSTALPVNSVQAGRPQTSSLQNETALKNPQLGVLLSNEQLNNLRPWAQATQQVTTPQVVMPQVTMPQIGVPQVSVPQVTMLQVGVSQVTTPQISVSQVTTPQVGVSQVTTSQVVVPQVTMPQVSAPQVTMPQVSEPQATMPPSSASYVVVYNNPPAAAEKRKATEYVDAVFNERDWPGLAPPPLVPARRWLDARPARELATLVVLAAARGCWRVGRCLVLGEPAAPPPGLVYGLRPLQRLLLSEGDEEDSGPTEPKQDKPAAPAAPAAPGRPWLKVKAFAKMSDDGAAQESAAAAPCVLVGERVHIKLSDAPPTYAKLLAPLAGLRECGAALLRRAPLYLYAPHSAQLAGLSGELNEDASAIILKGPPEMSEALEALSQLLNPAPRAPPAPRRPPGHPQLLNPCSSRGVSVAALRAAGDKQTYHLVLDNLHAGSTTREGGRRGCVDLSDEE